WPGAPRLGRARRGEGCGGPGAGSGGGQMSISELFIKRPVMTTLVMMGILVFGIMAYRLLPVSNLPNVDFPTIQVSAGLPGASPETMASAVATPLEKQFSTIAGVDQMTSSSSLGGTNITLQFTLDRNIDAAAQDVQAAISKTLRQLPTGIVPPSYQKVNPADQPIIYYALSSKTLSLPELDEYAETFIAQRLSMVDGVAQVNVFGAAKYAVRIQLDPKALATRSIGIDEVADGVAAGNVNLPTGILWGPHRAYTVQANGQLQDAAAPRVRGPAAPLRPLGVDSRLARRRAVHAVPDAGARRPGDLPVPAQPLGHDHPQPGAAVLAGGHVRGDVRARLQPRQPLDDGADVVGRVRGGRRHRDAGEHRAPHGEGLAPPASGVRRLARGGVHDPLHDAVARGGVH